MMLDTLTWSMGVQVQQVGMRPSSQPTKQAYKFGDHQTWQNQPTTKYV
jgi:hypothetical protein